MPDCCGDGPMKTILLCNKATLISLCETCKAGPPTAALCQGESFICVCSTYNHCVRTDIVHLYMHLRVSDIV